MSLTNQTPVTNIALQYFLQYCHIKTYPAKSSIIRPGDTGDRLYYIVDGSVSVSAEDDDGRELILAYLNKHDFIGEIGVFKGEEIRKVTIKTRTKCQLAEIGYERFKQMLHRELSEHAVELLFLLGEQISSRLLTTSRNYQNLAFLDVKERITQTLLDLCKQPDAITHPDGMQLRITRQEIGRIVGCSREMAGRVLKELEHQDSKITAKGKTIVVFGTR